MTPEDRAAERARQQARWPLRVAMPEADALRSEDPLVSPGLKLRRHVADALGLPRTPRADDLVLSGEDHATLMLAVRRWMHECRGLTLAKLRRESARWSLEEGPREDWGFLGVPTGTIFTRQPRFA